jgi:hypothetical protein
MQVTTTPFDPGEPIPKRFTADGEDVSPPLSIADVPDAADALAVVVDDLDAPSGVFTHWLLWNVPPTTTAIPAGVATTETVDALGGARQGTNDFGAVGYAGPKPPRGDDAHTYRFEVYALDAPLDVAVGARAEAVTAAIGEQRVDSALFTGTYER